MYNPINFAKAKKYWHMGTFYDWTEGHSHVMTHALHYGSSVFEGIRAYNTAKGPAVFRLSEHIDRFLYSASVLKMKPPHDKQEIIDIVKLVMRENKLESAYIRPLMFYAFGNLGLVPKFCPIELAVGAWEWGAYIEEDINLGTSAFIVPKKRYHHTQVDLKAKLGGLYVQSTIQGLEARSLGYDEALFLNLEGRIAEGPGENIFVVKNKTVKTNDLTESILQGITRTSILDLAKDLGYKTEVGPITKEELFTADEAFFTGTAVEVTPLSHVTDGSNPDEKPREHAIGTGHSGEITLKIRKYFADVVGGKVKAYDKWLTYVHE